MAILALKGLISSSRIYKKKNKKKLEGVDK